MGGSRKQETRDCKGIGILLAICPSRHRSEDLLPLPGVFWNLRLSRVSFLLSLFLLSPFPPCWASCHSLSLPLHWVFLMFSFYGWSFCRVWLLLCLVTALPGLSWGCFRQVRSKSWHHIMSVECVISSVLSGCRKNLKQWVDQCYSSVLRASQAVQW